MTPIWKTEEVESFIDPEVFTTTAESRKALGGKEYCLNLHEIPGYPVRTGRAFRNERDQKFLQLYVRGVGWGPNRPIVEIPISGFLDAERATKILNSVMETQ